MSLPPYGEFLAPPLRIPFPMFREHGFYAPDVVDRRLHGPAELLGRALGGDGARLHGNEMRRAATTPWPWATRGAEVTEQGQTGRIAFGVATAIESESEIEEERRGNGEEENPCFSETVKRIHPTTAAGRGPFVTAPVRRGSEEHAGIEDRHGEPGTPYS
jgi:hypothetical protein